MVGILHYQYLIAQDRVGAKGKLTRGFARIQAMMRL